MQVTEFMAALENIWQTFFFTKHLQLMKTHQGLTQVVDDK